MLYIQIKFVLWIYFYFLFSPCSTIVSNKEIAKGAISSTCDSYKWFEPSELYMNKKLVLEEIKRNISIVKAKSNLISNAINETHFRIADIKSKRESLSKQNKAEIDQIVKIFKGKVIKIFSIYMPLDTSFKPSIRKLIATMNILSGKSALEKSLKVPNMNKTLYQDYRKLMNTLLY